MNQIHEQNPASQPGSATQVHKRRFGRAQLVVLSIALAICVGLMFLAAGACFSNSH